MPKCSNCGLELAEDDRFCRRCGTPVAGHEQSSTVEAMAAEYRKVLDEHPDDADAHYSLALALMYHGRWSEAAEHLQRVAELVPAFTDALLRLAVCLAREGRLEDAEEAAERARASAPSNKDVELLLQQIRDLRASKQAKAAEEPEAPDAL